MTRTHEVEGRLAACELVLDELLTVATDSVVAREVPRYPPVRRDLAFVVAEDAVAGEVQAAIEQAAGELLSRCTLFDVFQGPPLSPGTKSLAFAIELRAHDRTLTSEDGSPSSPRSSTGSAATSAPSCERADPAACRRRPEARPEPTSARTASVDADRLRAVEHDYLSVDDLSPKELEELLDLAADVKSRPEAYEGRLAGRSIGLVFEKPSTRTRVSFEVGVVQLGAHPVVLSSSELQLGRGETIEDTGRVLSRFLDAIVLRTFEQERLEVLAGAADVPV